MAKFILLEPKEEPDAPAGATDDHAYVLHTETPRFLMQFVPGGRGDQGVMLIDQTDDRALVSRLAREACNFFCGEGNCDER